MKPLEKIPVEHGDITTDDDSKIKLNSIFEENRAQRRARISILRKLKKKNIRPTGKNT